MSAISLVISGVSGRMGQLVLKLAESERVDVTDGVIDGISSVYGVDLEKSDDLGFTPRLPQDLGDLLKGGLLRGKKVLLVFHNDPSSVAEQAQIASKNGISVIVGTTGLDSHCLSQLETLADNVPVVVSSNFSKGVNMFNAQIADAARMLGPGYQVEIVEWHHAKKADSPSGTAMMFAKTICEVWGWSPETEIVCGRSGRSAEGRPEKLIGIQSIRGGKIPGTHEVSFIDMNGGETLTYRHEAGGPILFAQGALAAVHWITGQKPGFYSMNDILGIPKG